MKYLIIPVLIISCITLYSNSVFCKEREIREYKGKRLDPYNRPYDNSIKGPQHVDIKKYRLEIKGEVKFPKFFSYKQILKFPVVKKAVTLHCVEGWTEHLLFEGVRLSDLFAEVKPKDGVKTVIFYAEDGYSSSLHYEEVKKLDLMLATKINGKILNALRGFPLQLVAESKLGYKWVKWITRIELSNKSYKGYWESRGYDNEANIK